MSIRSLLAAIAENSGSTEIQFQNMRRRQEDEKTRRKRRAQRNKVWNMQQRNLRKRKLSTIPRLGRRTPYLLDEILGVDINP